MMKKLDVLFPGYELAKNKGYPTAEHRTALYDLGYTNIHRLSFGPVRNVLLKRFSSG
jgi:ribonuclease HII